MGNNENGKAKTDIRYHTDRKGQQWQIDIKKLRKRLVAAGLVLFLAGGATALGISNYVKGNEAVADDNDKQDIETEQAVDQDKTQDLDEYVKSDAKFYGMSEEDFKNVILFLRGEDPTKKYYENDMLDKIYQIIQNSGIVETTEATIDTMTGTFENEKKVQSYDLVAFAKQIDTSEGRKASEIVAMLQEKMHDIEKDPTNGEKILEIYRFIDELLAKADCEIYIGEKIPSNNASNLLANTPSVRFIVETMIDFALLDYVVEAARAGIIPKVIDVKNSEGEIITHNVDVINGSIQIVDRLGCNNNENLDEHPLIPLFNNPNIMKSSNEKQENVYVAKNDNGIIMISESQLNKSYEKNGIQRTRNSVRG